MIKKIFVLVALVPSVLLGQNRSLNYYIQNALTNSPQLYDLRNQVLLNRIDSQILQASTALHINSTGNSYYAPVVNGWGYDEAITNGQQLQALITISKNLIPKKYLNLQFKDLQLTSDSLNIASKITQQDITKSIVAQYISTYGDQLQLQFNNQLINLLSREESILKILTQKNVYRQVDYLSFLVTYQQQNLSTQQLVAQYKNDYATLNYLAGIFDTTTATLQPPQIDIIKSFLTDTSAFFLKFTVDSLRLINNKALVAAYYRPQINLYTDFGYNSSLNEQSYKHFGRSYGINFTIPIYDGHQKKLQYSKLDVLEKTRIKNKEFFQNQYKQQIAQLLQQITLLDGLDAPINKQIKYLETLIEVNGKLLQTGDIKMTDYILTLNNYITAKNLLIQNTISRYHFINQLNYWNR